MTVQYLRAAAKSPYGLQWRHRAIAVDKHGCLVFVVQPPKYISTGIPDPLEVKDMEGENFEEVFGRFLDKESK